MQATNDHDVIDSVEVTGVNNGSPNKTLKLLLSFSIRHEVAKVDFICSKTSPSNTDRAVLVKSNGSAKKWKGKHTAKEIIFVSLSISFYCNLPSMHRCFQW